MKMHKFSWKRKYESLSKDSSSSVFSTDNQIKEDEVSEDMDWLDPIKKRKVLVLEDGPAKSERLKKEGVILAEANKWWSAIKKWQAALSYVPTDHTLHEMIAQAYMQVGEYVPSIKAAEECVSLAPLWWCGHQTLGRAFMGIGELHKAVMTFSVCLRLNPDNSELREHDLKWAAQLLNSYRNLQKENDVRKKEADDQKRLEEPEESSLQIIDFKENPEAFKKLIEDSKVSSKPKISSYQRSSISEKVRFVSCCSSNKSGGKSDDVSKVSPNVDLSKMVCMRPKLTGS